MGLRRGTTIHIILFVILCGAFLLFSETVTYKNDKFVESYQIKESQTYVSEKPVTLSTIKLLNDGIDENNIFNKKGESTKNIDFKGLDNVKFINNNGHEVTCIVTYFTRNGESLASKPRLIDIDKKVIEVVSVE